MSAPEVPAFALLHRPGAGQTGTVDILLGEVRALDRLADLPSPPPGRELLVLMPYRLIAERGFDCRDDGTPLLVLEVHARGRVGLAEALRDLPTGPAVLTGCRFDPDDAGYAALVRRVIAAEIGTGEGANFVLRRSLRATVANHSVSTSLAVYRRLLARERGTHWTFIVHCGDRTLIGASPERHASLAGGVVRMTPISGTWRYPAGGPTVPDLLAFLGDRKEAEELHMVVDEELKMMGRLCPDGGRLAGPRLRAMAHLAHTEYTITGRTGLGVADVLRETMYAPTVTGSPLANACRVISRHEPGGRGFYAGTVALVGERDGPAALDSAILIRTADIDRDGRLEIGVGATLVRHSDPDGEAAETRAKAAGLLAAFTGPDTAPPAAAADRSRLGADRRVRRALAARTEGLARFWFQPPGRRGPVAPELHGRRVLVVDAEDSFTAMFAAQVRALGPEVEVHPWQAVPDVRGYHIVVLGPGPGDPRRRGDPRVAALRRLAARLLAGRVPVLAVCLGHQVLATVLGLPVRRRPAPAQGTAREIDLFGRPERVGFYHTFAAYSRAARIAVPGLPGPVEVSRELATGEVYALRGPGLCSLQFHPESVLTSQGPAIVREALVRLTDGGPDE